MTLKPTEITSYEGRGLQYVKGRRSESIHKSIVSSNTEPGTSTTTTATSTTTEESVGPFAIVDAPIKIVPYFI
jgi:hypothetical protein